MYNLKVPDTVELQSEQMGTKLYNGVQSSSGTKTHNDVTTTLFE
jgi:hypothetical protein